MKWYWIVLLSAIYLLGWGIVIGIAEKDFDDPELGAYTGIAWPLLLPIYIGYKIINKYL